MRARRSRISREDQRRAFKQLLKIVGVMLCIPLGMIAVLEGKWRPYFDDTTVAGWTRGITKGHALRRAKVFGGLVHHPLLAKMPCAVLIDRLSDHERVRAVAVRALGIVVTSGRCAREVGTALDAARTPRSQRTLLNIVINAGPAARHVATSSVLRFASAGDDSTRADAILTLLAIGDTSVTMRSTLARAARDPSRLVRLTARDAERALWPPCGQHDTTIACSAH